MALPPPADAWSQVITENLGDIVPLLSNKARHTKVNTWLGGHIPRLAIWAALVIACAASLVVWCVDARYEFDLLPKDIAHDGGAAFRVRIAQHLIWPWRRSPDTISEPRNSRLVLLEDNRPLGPAHDTHRDIRNLGNGGYSHWTGYILFSASDNSDPRTNGRRYQAVDFAGLSPVVGELPWLLLFAWAAVNAKNSWILVRKLRFVRRLFFTYRAFERRIGTLGVFLILTAPVVVFVNDIFIRHWPLPPTITPDTALYLGFNEVRTIGYPVFLKMVAALFGDLRPLVAIQLNLLLGSIVMLGWAVARVVGSVVCGVALVLALALNPSLLTWTNQVMTEGLFIPLLLTHAAFALLLLKRPSRASAALAGTTLVAVMLVRPAAYSLLLNLPLLILLLRGRQITILAWMLIPAATLYVAAAGAHRVVLGTWQSQSFGGYTLLGKVALLIHGDIPGAPPVGEELYQRIADQVREAETKKFPAELLDYTSNWYDKILYKDVYPVMSDYVKRVYPSDTGEAVWRRMNAVAWSLALRAIAQDPIGYLKLVLAQYYGLWSITFTATVPIGEGYINNIDQSLTLLRQDPGLRSLSEHVGLGEDTFLVARAPYLRDARSYSLLDRVLQKTIPAYRFMLVRIAVCVIFLLCPYWLWWLFTGRPVEGPSAAMLYLGATLTGYYLLIASVEFAVGRYVQAFDGITLTIDMIALYVVLIKFWTIVPVALPVFLRRRPVQVVSGNISAAKIGRP